MLGVMVADALNNFAVTAENNGYFQKYVDSAQNYTDATQRENTRYWDDYLKNTGKTPKYPYRSGAVNDISQLYNLDYQRVSGNNSVYQAGTNVGTAGAYGYSMYDSKRYHTTKTNGNNAKIYP